MLMKTFLIVCLATLAASYAKDDNDIISVSLGTGTNLLRELTKLVTEDADKFGSVDLNSLYKKFDIAAKMDQAKGFLQNQIKLGTGYTNQYFKKLNIETEEILKKSIDVIKKEDPVLADKLNKYYEQLCDGDRAAEEIVKYILDSDKLTVAFDKVKAALSPLEQKLIESVKKFETIVLEHLPKKGKGHY